MLGALMGAGQAPAHRRVAVHDRFLQHAAARRRRSRSARRIPERSSPSTSAELGGELIAQKDSFLAAAKGVSIGIAFQRKLGVGLFGGEGFIMQRLQGDGWAFVHAGGTLHERTLAAGELIRVDTGCIVAMQPSVNYDIQYVGKIKSALFGGEGPVLRHAARTRPRVAAVAAARAGWRTGSSRPCRASAAAGAKKAPFSVAIGGLLDGDNS